MVDIDEEKLQNLMELVIKEHPDLDPYVVWIITSGGKPMHTACTLCTLCTLFKT
jgi:hypothetical protein